MILFVILLHLHFVFSLVFQPFSCGTGMTMHLQAGDKLWVTSSYAGPFYTAPWDNVFSVTLLAPDV